MNAFKLNYANLQAKSVDARRASIAKQVAFALSAPALLIKEFQAELLAKSLGKSANEPSAERFKSAIESRFLDAETLAGKGAAAGTAVAQKYATASSNPILTTATGLLTQWFHQILDFDLGYEALYDLVDMRGTNQSAFKVNTTASGVTWSQRGPSGARIEIKRDFAETQSSISYLEFVAGVGIEDRFIQFNEFYTIEDLVNEFIAAGFAKRASIHYGLMTAQSSGIDVTFATDDTTTFNSAAAKILRDCRNKGYALGDNAQFDIVVNPEKVGRILAMLDAKRGSPIVAFGTQDQPIAYNVRNVITTTEVPAADTGYYLVLPGRRMKRGVWMDPTLESARDITASATDWVGREQYNAVIGDTSQLRRVKYA